MLSGRACDDLDASVPCRGAFSLLGLRFVLPVRIGLSGLGRRKELQARLSSSEEPAEERVETNVDVVEGAREHDADMPVRLGDDGAQFVHRRPDVGELFSQVRDARRKRRVFRERSPVDGTERAEIAFEPADGGGDRLAFAGSGRGGRVVRILLLPRLDQALPLLRDGSDLPEELVGFRTQRSRPLDGRSAARGDLRGAGDERPFLPVKVVELPKDLPKIEEDTILLFPPQRETFPLLLLAAGSAALVLQERSSSLGGPGELLVGPLPQGADARQSFFEERANPFHLGEFRRKGGEIAAIHGGSGRGHERFHLGVDLPGAAFPAGRFRQPRRMFAREAVPPRPLQFQLPTLLLDLFLRLPHTENPFILLRGAGTFERLLFGKRLRQVGNPPLQALQLLLRLKNTASAFDRARR